MADPAELEQAMYADLENELVLASFRPPQPDDLIYHYNLSLAQTLLFKATQLKFRASAGHKDVLRQVKRLGMMYDAEYNDGRVDITVDGPASAMKLTERYGTALAKLLPFITASEGWNVEATIVRKDFSGAPRVYRFVAVTEKARRPVPGRGPKSRSSSTAPWRKPSTVPSPRPIPAGRSPASPSR